MTSSRRPGAAPRVPGAPARGSARGGAPARPPGADELFGAGTEEFEAALDVLGPAEDVPGTARERVPPEASGAGGGADADLEGDFDVDVEVDVDLDGDLSLTGDPGALALARGPDLDLDLDRDRDPDLDLDLDRDPRRAPAPAASTPPRAASAPWPSAVPDGAEAADALARALAGAPVVPGTPLAAAAAAVAALTPFERSVLEGEPHPIDPAPIHRAAVMRVRLHAALSAPPAPGAPLDAGALSALFGEIDALLSDLRTLAEDAPADLTAPLEAVRGAFVRETLRLSAAARAAGPRRP